jgi:hypothetical protein
MGETTTGRRPWARTARNVGLGLLVAIVAALAASNFFGPEVDFLVFMVTLEILYLAVGLTLVGAAFLTSRLWLRWPLAVLGVFCLLVSLGNLLRSVTVPN